jgi:transposase
MGMLANETDFVIGGDAHLDAHALAVVRSLTAAVVAQRSVDADAAGYRAALSWARRQAPGRRVWALEGTGSYSAGLTRFLAAQGERVIEVDRPARAETAGHLKSDQLDAIRAARTALGRERVAIQPRRGERREALRVLMATRRSAVEAQQVAINQLRALLVTAPDELRAPLRRLTRAQLLARCRELRPLRGRSISEQATRSALRACARRIQALRQEARQHERQICALVRELAPQLLAEHGVGPICAAEILIVWSHPGRFPREAHFARLAGVAPIPAGTGKHARLRLDPRGDRQLNRALHTILLARRRGHPPTLAYLERRQAEGRSTRDAIRCLKRYLARHLYRLLEHPPATA